MCCIPKRRGGVQYVKQRVLTSYRRLNIVGCLLKKGLQRGGYEHDRKSPLPPPLVALLRRENACGKPAIN